MVTSQEDALTDLSQAFLQPTNATHRQYEALRAFFVDDVPSAEAAARFGYTAASFRVLCHQFRQNPRRTFFVEPKRGPGPTAEKKTLKDKIVALRKRNLSVYDIQAELRHSGEKLSVAAIAMILQQEGFARLPRRKDDERPTRPRPEAAAIADARKLDLSPRAFRTQFGGLFLFIPLLVEAGFDTVVRKTRLPGSKVIPAAHALRSLLALKLFGSRRHSHMMSYVMDDGLALFAGLNTIPKRSFLTEYSCRIEPSSYPVLMRRWFDAVSGLGLERGLSFDLDFHTIPFHGEDALLQKHYITKRSRRQKGVLAFLAEDADRRVFVYANGHVRKEDQNDEILEFVKFWKKRTGKLPSELVFDSKLTTYSNLNRLNDMGIPFITLRRRTRQMVAALLGKPPSAWRRIKLDNIARAYATPRVIDRKVALRDYEGPIREIAVIDLGHEQPTILITNQLKRAAKKLIGRYAQRMVIENSIADGIDFFHMDALSSAVAMKVDCDLQLTLIASSLYRILGARVGNGYETAKSHHIFRDLVDATAHVVVGNDIQVNFPKRAHNPLLLAAGLHHTDIPIPWLGGKHLHLTFG